MLISVVATGVMVVGITGIGAQQAVPAPKSPAVPVKPAVSAPASETRAEDDRIALRIELSLSRHQGDKRISNLPFTLLTTVGSQARLRVGSNVPIQDGIGPVNYQSVGTNIDAALHAAGSGRYRLELNIADSSVAEPSASTQRGPAAAGSPVIRTNSLNTTLMLRNGQATELVVATDRVSGETIKAEVRVTEIK
jgi:hypothetical protein